MKAAGVITEYNPFHKGHKFQLDKIRQQTNADYIVVAMSGNFVQRGEPAIADKYTRAHCALLNGADLVLEIPSIWATASAEYFATAGVNLLNSTSVIDSLCFGAESDSLDAFIQYAHLLNNESNSIKSQISHFQKEGLSYPAARLKAFKNAYNSVFSSSFWDDVNLPNNTLAIEYLRAFDRINPDIKPVLIQRIGSGYHDTSTDADFSSASAIRGLLSKETDSLRNHIPASCVNLMNDFNDRYGYVFAEEISPLLAYKLLLENSYTFEKYADITQTLSGSINKNIYRFESFGQFCELLKSKNYAYTRISRALLHVMLNITDSSYDNGKKCHYTPYLRVLGFKKEAGSLLHAIKKEAACPLITKLADASSILDNDSLAMLKHDIFCCDVYNQLIINHRKNIPLNEFIHGPVII